MKARCSKCLSVYDCEIWQPSDFGGWQDYVIHCTKCHAYETAGYLSRENKIVGIPLESRGIASMHPEGSA